ncbi:MAG TPA: OmpA family protein, partial [Methylophilaceae bacterium]|nr:OmpA family protein [Methylophilaceae bacterium]
GFQADLRHQISRARIKIDGIGSDTETIGNNILSIGGFVRFGAPAPVVAEAAPEPAPIPVAEPAPEPEPVAKVCEKTKRVITVDAEKLFEFDSAKLNGNSKESLDSAVAEILSHPDITLVLVTGHTDRLGSYSYNQKLSEARAKAVGDYLASNGVDPSIITTTGRGEAVPVVECKGIKNRKALIECLAPNRRVEISTEHTEEVGCE